MKLLTTIILSIFISSVTHSSIITKTYSLYYIKHDGRTNENKDCQYSFRVQIRETEKKISKLFFYASITIDSKNYSARLDNQSTFNNPIFFLDKELTGTDGPLKSPRTQITVNYIDEEPSSVDIKIFKNNSLEETIIDTTCSF